jgi:DNA (cytosine-5)-methyltransferase 1
MIIDGFAGPGGWDVAAAELGLAPVVGIELDAAACATRAAAGLATIRADMAAFDVSRLAGNVTGQIHSPECTTFSQAGTRGGVTVLEELAALIRDMFAQRPTRSAHRRNMNRALRAANWPPPKTRPSKYNKKHKTPARLTREQRSAAIRRAVLSASLVAEPARFIAACDPEWVALEQVPDVLPLWQVYAAELRNRGYSVWVGKLNAADYGVPQTRERAILIASRVRRVARPEPTHYDPRKGMQLWGTPWVSMSDALGWGATERPVPTVTAGGTKTGGAEPFGHRDRDALAAERDAGQWVVRTSFGQPSDTDRNGNHEMDPSGRPSHAVTTKARSWVLHTGRDQRPDGSRQTADPQTAPAPAPAPALTAKSGGQWTLRMGTKSKATLPRSASAPAPTILFGHDSGGVTWVHERPATTVQGDPLAGRPGHKNRDKGEAQFEQDSVRITVEEAAALQSFPADYPWQGTKTKRFEQCGNAIPPDLARHILAEASGVKVAEAAA